MNETKLNSYTQSIRASLTRREENTKQRLLENADLLRRKMERLITSLNEESSFNTLGEVQALGSEVDRLCGELATIRRIKDDTLNMVSEAMILDEVFGAEDAGKEG